jgi:preprotein translocase subunit Sec61beta
MAKNNNVRMPSSGAGITSYNDEMGSKFNLDPGVVIVFIVVMIIMVAILHYFGARMVGL